MVLLRVVTLLERCLAASRCFLYISKVLPFLLDRMEANRRSGTQSSQAPPTVVDSNSNATTSSSSHSMTNQSIPVSVPNPKEPQTPPDLGQVAKKGFVGGASNFFPQTFVEPFRPSTLSAAKEQASALGTAVLSPKETMTNVSSAVKELHDVDQNKTLAHYGGEKAGELAAGTVTGMGLAKLLVGPYKKTSLGLNLHTQAETVTKGLPVSPIMKTIIGFGAKSAANIPLKLGIGFGLGMMNFIGSAKSRKEDAEANQTNHPEFHETLAKKGNQELFSRIGAVAKK